MTDILLYLMYAIIFGLVVVVLGAVLIALWSVLRAIWDEGAYFQAVQSRWSVAWNWFSRRILEHV